MTYKTISLNYINAYELEEGYIVFTTKTNTLRDTDIPLGANPRKPSMANRNVKAMIAQLESDPTNFRKKNEGISIVANKAVVDSEAKKVIFEVNEKQGIINGGHTYYTLSNYGVPEATVRIEINTGVPDELTTDIASARNASKKLSLESELHHIGMFEWIKRSVSAELRTDIKFFEGDEGEIEVGELLQVANVINPTRNVIDNAKRSYNSKGAILGDLKRHGMNASIVRTRKCLEQMWDLYQYIRTDEDLRDRLLPMIYENESGQMYKGVAFFILAGVLQRRTGLDNKGEYVTITTPLNQLKDIVALKADAINGKIMRLNQHFVGKIDSLVGSETFVEGIENVFLK